MRMLMNKTVISTESLVSNIRTATLHDSKSINNLSLHLGYGSTPQDLADERLKCLLESKNDWVWVFEESDDILGWIHLFKAHRVASSTFYEIGGLVVNPETRNVGIGRRLVEFAVKHSEVQKSELRVRCNSKRLDSHLFYEKTGFVNSKKQFVYRMSL
ncbi:GNAT family N-acetyltransferase [Neptunomonas phycophila]|uniref:GNAT family N-acetyltransferase n=1 Tax=Neptunomonas phycophila TaxID=1572645 RepID=UPI0015C08D2E|nr:GNAT family N-acetyltransferase [Neptunomonas phycophila]